MENIKERNDIKFAISFDKLENCTIQDVRLAELYIVDVFRYEDYFLTPEFIDQKYAIHRPPFLKYNVLPYGSSSPDCKPINNLKYYTIRLKFDEDTKLLKGILDGRLHKHPAICKGYIKLVLRGEEQLNSYSFDIGRFIEFPLTESLNIFINLTNLITNTDTPVVFPGSCKFTQEWEDKINASVKSVYVVNEVQSEQIGPDDDPEYILYEINPYISVTYNSSDTNIEKHKLPYADEFTDGIISHDIYDKIIAAYNRPTSSYDIATETTDGLMSSSDKIKLNGFTQEWKDLVLSGISNISIKSEVSYIEQGSADDLEYIQCEINPYLDITKLNGINNTINLPYASSYSDGIISHDIYSKIIEVYYRPNVTYNEATHTTAGLMSAADKIKLDSINTEDLDNIEVTLYVLPVASTTQLGGIKVGEGLDITTDGTLSVSNTQTSTPSLTTNWKVMTQEQYEALAVIDPDVFYFLYEDDEDNTGGNENEQPGGDDNENDQPSGNEVIFTLSTGNTTNKTVTASVESGILTIEGTVENGTLTL